MSSVELYIYDLSAGYARNLGSSFGLDIDGIWHTAIVVYGEEWFFGAQGIGSVEPPATTVLGSPMKVITLGRTEFPKEEFLSLLTQMSHGRFKVGTYDIFRHNCNNFSQELAELLCNASIPRNILDLPKQVLDSPVAQLLAPFIEKYTQPTGRAFLESEQPRALLPYTKYEVFGTSIDTELFLKKFKKLCVKNNTQFSESLERIFRSFFGSRKENTAFMSFIWPFIDSHIDDWAEEDLIPFLDTIRWSVGFLKLDASTYKRIHGVCMQQLNGNIIKQTLTFRLILRIWCNFFVHDISRQMVVNETESIIASLNKALEQCDKPLDSHVQKGIASLCLNYAVHNTQVYDEEKSTIVIYSLVPQYFLRMDCAKAAIRGLYALGTYMITNCMAKQIALALDAQAELTRLNERIELKDFSYEEAMRECKRILEQPV